MKICLKNSSKIIKKYRNLLEKIVNQFAIFEKDEAMDEARFVTIEAIMDFDEKKAGFGGYLKYRLYYYFLDKNKKQIPISLNEKNSANAEIEELLISDVDIEKDLLEKEKYQMLHRAIKNLDKRDKKIIELKYFKNKSHKEIGKILNISAKTVTNNHLLILKKLRSQIKKYESWSYKR